MTKPSRNYLHDYINGLIVGTSDATSKMAASKMAASKMATSMMVTSKMAASKLAASKMATERITINMAAGRTITNR